MSVTWMMLVLGPDALTNGFLFNLFEEVLHFLEQAHVERVFVVGAESGDLLGEVIGDTALFQVVQQEIVQSLQANKLLRLVERQKKCY